MSNLDNEIKEYRNRLEILLKEMDAKNKAFIYPNGKTAMFSLIFNKLVELTEQVEKLSEAVSDIENDCNEVTGERY